MITTPPQGKNNSVNSRERWEVREDINEKKRFLSGIARMRGGGLPMPEFFGPLSRGAFLVNRKSLFPQKCQCTELFTVFQVAYIQYIILYI